MVFVGNTKHTVPYMLKHSDLFEELPEKYYDSAFIDRLHSYVPGWEIDVIRGEMFATGYGFVVDYLAEILRHMRNDDYSNRYRDQFSLSSDISTRDRDGVNKTFSGMMKLLFPADDATEAEQDRRAAPRPRRAPAAHPSAGSRRPCRARCARARRRSPDAAHSVR